MTLDEGSIAYVAVKESFMDLEEEVSALSTCDAFEKGLTDAFVVHVSIDYCIFSAFVLESRCFRLNDGVVMPLQI
jgi:hypothetical protein